MIVKKDLPISFNSINIDGEERHFTFSSVAELETEWFKENPNLPANDDFIVHFIFGKEKRIFRDGEFSFETMLSNLGIDIKSDKPSAEALDILKKIKNEILEIFQKENQGKLYLYGL